jgi:hypothetical protein
VRAQLEQRYVKDQVGPRIHRWQRRNADAVNFEDSFDTLHQLGGNVAGPFLVIDRYPLLTRRVGDGKVVLGTTRQDGCVLVRAPAGRVRGVAVLSRLPASDGRALTADFKAIIHGSTPEDQRWSARVELSAGQETVSVPFEAELGGGQVQLWVSQASARPPAAFAGFRDLEIFEPADSEEPPRLRSPNHQDTPADPGVVAALVGSMAWRPQRVVIRGGQAAPDGLELASGGEVWLRTANMSGAIDGQMVRAGSGGPAFARVLWSKGGRLEVLQQVRLLPGQPAGFHAQTPEPGGWVGIMVDPTPTAAPVRVRIDQATLQP